MRNSPLVFVAAGALLALTFTASCAGYHNPPECQQADDGCVLPPGGNGDGGTLDGGSSDGGDTGDGDVIDAGTPCGTGFCSTAAPICENPSTSRCVTCTATQGCAGIAPICRTAVDGGQCIECTRTEDCPAIARNCDVPSGLCFSADGGRPHAVVDAGTSSDGGTTSDGGTGGDGGTTDGGTGGDDGGTAQDGGSDPDGGTLPDGGAADAGAGDNCTDAIPFAVPDGGTTRSFTVNTAGFTDDLNGTGACNLNMNETGPDVVVKITLPTTLSLNITVARPVNGTSDPTIYLRRNGCSAGMQVACSNSSPVRGTPEIISAPNLAAGEYYLVIDSLMFGGFGDGPMDVTISASP